MRGQRRLASASVFRMIQVALLPVGTVGYLWAVPKLLLYSRRTGASATVFGSLYTRCMQHRLGTRPDEPAARLMKVMPNVSRVGFGLETLPTLVGHLLTGYVPRIYRYPYEGEPPLRHQVTGRTSFYDAAIQRHLRGIDQVVVLGGGFDTRAFRPSEGHVRWFEIDRCGTQAFKIRMLKNAGLASRHVAYVAADLQTEDWFGKLVAAGFDPARPAFFLLGGCDHVPGPRFRGNNAPADRTYGRRQRRCL
jgi:hypothetical protein